MHFTLLPADRGQYEKLVHEHENSRVAYKVLPRSLFISMVTQFDLFVGTLIKLILHTQPNIISPEKPLTYGDLKGFKTIGEVVDNLIEKEIDSLLFDSHTAHLDWIGKKLALDLHRVLSAEWPIFAELTERRNLYVHTDGVINNRYVSKCSESGYLLDKEHRIGFELPMSPEYFKRSSECLYKIATKLSFIVWNKLVPKDVEAAADFFNDDIGIELIKRKRYGLAESLLEFAVSGFAGSADQTKRVFIINLALAKKSAGRAGEAMALIDAQDWSSANDELQLGVAVLKEDYPTALKLMERIGKRGKIIVENSYLNDPIFSSLRKQVEFGRIYKKIFGKKFNYEKPEIIPPPLRPPMIRVSLPKLNLGNSF